MDADPPERASPKGSATPLTADEAGVQEAYAVVDKHAPPEDCVPVDEARRWPVKALLKAMLDYAPSQAGRGYIAASILQAVNHPDDIVAGLDDFAGHWIGTVLIPRACGSGLQRVRSI